MRYLTLADSNVDPESYRRYQQHLDAVQDKLPPALYRMLRFPEDAYRDGNTIYDSTLVEWRDLLSTDDCRRLTQIRILSPNQDQEYLFTLHEPVTIVTTPGPVFRLGGLYCLELSWHGDSGLSLSFVYITRTEIQVSCDTLEFEVRAVR